MATTYDMTSDVEFTASYTTASGGFYEAANSVFSAFSKTGTSGTIVSVLFGMYGQTAGGTINAGWYSHIEYNAPVASPSTTSMTIGETSKAANSSYYSTAPNKVTPAASNGGPSDANTGYGTLEIGPIGIGTTFSKGITFSGINNTLVFDTSTPNIASLGTLNNFQAAGDQIVLNGVAAATASITSYSNGTLTYVNNGVSYQIIFGGMAAGVGTSNFAIGSVAAIEGGNASTFANNLVISYVPCFLRGTMIATPDGERPVESFRAGDLVSVLEGGALVARPLVWTGGQTMQTGEFADPGAMCPIRIRSGAFADAIPHRDLLVTPEHCILTEAGLVPARMLVNGSSILIDRSIPDYAFFHLELERHGILLSEGLATESYLDTGNRGVFASAGATDRPVVMAAPLAVSRALVEPLWNRLVARAGLLGFAPTQTSFAVTSQPDLRLLLDDGRELGACLHHEHRHMFHIPQGTRPLRLLSRSAIPAETIGPFVDDRRTLGVAVDRLVLWAGLDETVLAAADMNLDGWHSHEASGRWTDGNAGLDLPEAGSDTFLDVHVAATTFYRDEACMAG